MNLKETLQADLKTAMRAGDTAKRDTLRLMLASIKQAEVDSVDPSKRDGGLSEETIIAILTREAKRRREAIEGFEKGGSPERAAQERSELELIESYLPRLMGRAELEPIVRQAIADSGATSEKQMGAIMTKLMPQIKGKADGKLVNQIVKDMLASH